MMQFLIEIVSFFFDCSRYIKEKIFSTLGIDGVPFFTQKTILFVLKCVNDVNLILNYVIEFSANKSNFVLEYRFYILTNFKT